MYGLSMPSIDDTCFAAHYPNVICKSPCHQVVGTPPPGKAYFRCICNTLLVYDECKSFVKCPMKEW